MIDPLDRRRAMIDAAKRFLIDPAADRLTGDGRDPRLVPDDSPPRLTLRALEKIIPMSSRSRERILENLDEMYREAFERAKGSGDQAQMTTLDFAYRREQLYFEILLDVRDAIERR
jgi:hypothetical protein